MKRILIAILTALTLLAGWTPAAHAADRTPLLMEGKKTLYQRVITHPGASLYAGQGEGSTVIQKAVRPFSVFYVYTRDGNWLEVGAELRKAARQVFRLADIHDGLVVLEEQDGLAL